MGVSEEHTDDDPLIQQNKGLLVSCEQHETQQPTSELDSLQAQQQQYQEWVIQYVAANAASSTAALGPASFARAVAAAVEAAKAAGIPAAVAALYSTSTAHGYLTYLKYWADTVWQLQRAVRDLGALPRPGKGVNTLSLSAVQHQEWEAYAGAVSAALDALGTALGGSDYAAGYLLYTRLSEDVAALLSALHWPPPLTPAPGPGPAAGLDTVGHAGMTEDRKPAASGHTSEATNGVSGGISPDYPGQAPATGEPHAPGVPQAGMTATGSSAPRQSGANFAGFQSDPAAAAGLVAVLGLLTRLQMLVERAAFAQLGGPSSSSAVQQQQQEGEAGGGPGAVQPPGGGASAATAEEPLLWAATALAAPLQARLQAQFDPSTPAGRLDRPEWVFQLVLRLVQDNMKYMSDLQPCIIAAGLGQHFHMAVEWARAMRSAAKAVLRTARLPSLMSLTESGDPRAQQLWGLHVEAVLDFEAKLRPFLGASGLQGAEVLPDALLLGSVLGAFTEDAPVMAAWMEVEKQAAMHRVEAALCDERAWQAHGTGSGDEELDEAGGGGVIGGGGAAEVSRQPPHLVAGRAWKHEFCPPHMAKEVSLVVGAVIERSKHLPTAAAQQEYLSTVAGAVLSHAKEVLTHTLEQASHLRNVSSLDGHAPRLGAAVSAARFLHHTVSELLAGPALSRLVAARGAGAAGARPEGEALPSMAASPQQGLAAPAAPGVSLAVGSGLSTSPGPDLTYWGTTPLMTPAKGGLLGDVVVRPGFAPLPLPSPPALAMSLAELAALHRDAVLRVVRELALGFGRAAVGYREAVEQASQYPTHEGAAGTVTPALVPALTYLQAALRALSHTMDGPSFQDIWRALTVPVNRFLFNYVATEARFSPAGAQQFATDCAGLLTMLAEFVRRPEAHFKETLAAARLLTLPEDYCPQIISMASTQQVAGQPLWKHPYLAQLKIGCLSAEQVVAVIQRRL